MIKSLAFIGGIPRLIVPVKPERLSRALIVASLSPVAWPRFSRHYDVAMLPARPAHPRDKTQVSYCLLC